MPVLLVRICMDYLQLKVLTPNKNAIIKKILYSTKNVALKKLLTPIKNARPTHRSKRKFRDRSDIFEN